MPDDYAAPINGAYGARPHPLASLIGTGTNPAFASNGRLAAMLMHVMQRRSGMPPGQQGLPGNETQAPVMEPPGFVGFRDRRGAAGLPYAGQQFR